MNDTHVLKVPKDFGNIEYDPNNYYYPWKAQEVESMEGDQVSYNDIGNYESFSHALLALVASNTLTKKQRAKDGISPETRSAADYLYYKTMETQGLTSTSGTRSGFAKNGNLVIGFKSDTLPREYDQPKPIYNPNTFGTFQGGANPYLDYSNPLMNLTFKEVFERWYADKQHEDITKRTLENYQITYKKVKHLDDIPFVQIRYSQIYDCVIQEKLKGNSFSMRKRVKLFFSQLYQWAIAHEMCTNNIALNIKLGKNESDFHRKPFTIEQVQELLRVADQISFAGEVAMLILCGCRIGEFLNIRREDIHIDQRYFIVTESKTKVGRNRIVPIHKKAMRFWRSHLRAKSDYLIHDARGRQVEYKDWALKFKKLMKYLEWEGMSIHGCRHTCATLLHTFGADGMDARFILGHTQIDIHERIYQHAQASKLIQAIDLIKI